MERKPTYASWLPVTGEGFVRYRKAGVPPLQPDKIHADLYAGAERVPLNMIFTGDFSYFLSYKGRPGYAASFAEENNLDDVSLLQLQGGKQEGYRVMSALRVVDFMADQIHMLVEHPESPYRRITMPPHAVIQGVVDATEEAVARYSQFAHRLGLSYSETDRAFVVDVVKK